MGFKTEQEQQPGTSLLAASSQGRLWWQALKMINCSRIAWNPPAWALLGVKDGKALLCSQYGM